MAPSPTLCLQGTWVSYVKGAIAKFAVGYEQEANTPFVCPAFSAVVDGSIPRNIGLSSSASLIVSVITFLEELTSCRFKPEKKVLLCKAAENEFAGVPCGIMDHLISVMGRQGTALMVDCRSLETIAVPTGGGSQAKFLVTNSTVKHTLSEGGCPYKARVASCQEAVTAVNRHTGADKAALRDVELAEVDAAFAAGAMSDETMRRARHVVSENLRCQRALTAFKDRDFAGLGKLMHESHQSLKEDYQVSCAELDALVDIAMEQEGVWGSRMTGAGFGGCIVTLVAPDKLEAVQAALTEGFRSKFGKECTHIVSDACAGARRVDMALYFPDQHGHECLVQANILKGLGNELFKHGDLSGALQKYNRIPLAIKGLLKKEGGGGGGMMMGMPNNKDEEALTEGERSEVKLLWQTCHINRAMCYIKLEKWDKGIEACNEAITAGSEDVKAYFRRGKCYRHVGELDKARADFDVVLAKDSNDANVRKELAEIAKRQKVQVCVCVSVCVCERERERENERELCVCARACVCECTRYNDVECETRKSRRRGKRWWKRRME